MSYTQKTTLVGIGAILVTASCAGWIYYSQFKAPKHNVALHERIGEVLAEQTAKVVGPKGRLVVLTIPAGADPELKTQLEGFHRALKRLGQYDTKEHEVDTKDQLKYRAGSGLSGRKFVRAVKNHPRADALVSFIGIPSLSADEVAQIGTRPKFIAESCSTEHLSELFTQQILQAAVVSRFEFPAPGPHKPKTPQQWFDKRYQIVTASDAGSISQAN
jgi:hypothetical protein